MSYKSKRKLSSFFISLLLALGQYLPFLTVLPAPAFAANPSASLEQVRNGSASSPTNPPLWVKGNAGSSNAHYVEGYSVAYRTVMEDLPTGTPITLTLGYDIKHSGKQALDYLTHYQRLEPHDLFGHATETVDPTDDVSGVSGVPDSTFPILAPSSSSSPVLGQPGDSFNDLPANERVMSLWNGTITAISYNTQGDLSASNSAETHIDVTFTASSSTAVLSWGGHMASSNDWGSGNAAGGISGSPYHMRLIDWDLGNLGNQDRSLSAGAVTPAPATITVIKDVQPNDASTWDFALTSSEFSDGVTLGDGDQHTFSDLVADSYTLAETTNSDYATSFSCTRNGQPAESDTGNSVVLDLNPGDEAVCTFTNSINTGTIIVEKQTVPDQALGSFEFTDDAAGIISDGGQIIVGDLLPGTYTSTEIVPLGWDLTDITCSDANSTGDTGTATATFNLDPGEIVTCTFTNSRLPTLTVIKTVTNDNGGDALVEDFDLFVDLTPVLSGDTNVFEPGDYVVGEIGLDGYLLTSITGDCDGQGNVNLDYGDDFTCTITNDDTAPTITLIKTVVNGDGGIAGENDFGLRVGGQLVNSGDTTPVDANTPIEINEDGLTGYEFVSITGDVECPQVLGGTATLDEGIDVTCTITNDDVAPELTVIKHVINDNGGNAVAGDFTMNVNGTNVSDPSFPGDELGTTVTLNAGSYSVDETGPSGYSDDYSADCSGTIAVGEQKICTITNDDVAPTITLIKIVINDNGGTALPTDFGLRVGGNLVDPGQTVQVQAYTPIEINENGIFGYAFVSLENQVEQSGCPVELGGTVNLGPGESLVCIVTNDDIPPTLTVIKTVINDGIGAENPLSPSDFPITVADTLGTFIANFPGSDAGTTLTSLDASTYNVSENGSPLYTATFSGDCDAFGDVTLNIGDEKTCTIINDDGDVLGEETIDGDVLPATGTGLDRFALAASALMIGIILRRKSTRLAKQKA